MNSVLVRLLWLSLHGCGIAAGAVAMVAAVAGAGLAVVVHPAFAAIPVVVVAVLWPLAVAADRRDARMRRPVREAWDSPTMLLPIIDRPEASPHRNGFADRAAGAESPTTPHTLPGRPAVIRRDGPTIQLPAQRANNGDDHQ